MNGDHHTRAALMLAWPPFCLWLATVLDRLLGSAPVNTLQIMLGALTMLTAGFTPILWRVYVRWTRRSVLATLVLVLIMLTNVVVWQPMLPVGGCGAAEIMIASQSLALTGIWWIGCVVAWWGGLCLAQSPALSGLWQGGRLMSADVARLLICMALFPLLYGVGGIWVTTEQHLGFADWEWTRARALVFAHVMAILVPLWLWRARVNWTRGRVVGTVLLGAIMLLSPITVPVTNWLMPVPATSGGWAPASAVVEASPYLAQAIWIWGAAWLWRYRPGERLPVLGQAALDAHVLARCPQCEYDLRGQREIRCPECGWSATVDQFLENRLATALEV